MRVVYSILLIISLSSALACSEQKVAEQRGAEKKVAEKNPEPKQKKHSSTSGPEYSSYVLSKIGNGKLQLKNHLNQKILLRVSGKNAPELRGSAGNCRLSKDRLTLAGWLADVNNQTAPNEVIVFSSADYRFLESNLTWSKREDLKEVNLGPIGTKPIGFRLQIAGPAPAQPPIVVAIYDKFAQHVGIGERCEKRFE